MQEIIILAPSKVNLRLEVLRKRADGYHDLRSIMERLTLHDEVTLRIVEKGLQITCDNADVPQDEDNIAFKALKEILAYSSRNVGIEVHIKKNIPIASGMGGGSSNAAAVIKGINELLKLKLSQDKLIKIGLKVGADVPFFLFDGPALAAGVGEQLTKINLMPKMQFLIVNPGIKVSTKQIFSKYSIEKNLGKSIELPNAYRTKRDIIKMLRNDLEKVTLKDFPIIGDIKQEMLKQGAIASQMTGSGPTVFGIFADKIKLTKAFEQIEKKAQEGWQIFMAENLAA